MEMERRAGAGAGAEADAPKFGGSLLVPCVKELAKDQNLVKLPPRYMRSTEEDPNSPNVLSNLDSSLSSHFPVIDMQCLSPDHLNHHSQLDNLHHACKHWGFFQVINHGVSSELLESVKVRIQELFNLPIEEKRKLWQKPDDLEGFGQVFVVSEEQKLDWADMLYLLTLPTHLRNPRLFSNLPPSLRVTLEGYSLEMKKVALKLLEVMAEALGMDKNEMRSLFEEGHQTMRMNYYPPCPQPECAIGLNSHSDASGLTILLQINDIEGLQIRKDGAWIPVRPLPNAFIVNVGDTLEIISNGIYRSIEHRATVNKEKERLSIATFYNPKMDGELGPAPSLISSDTPPLFKRIGVAEFYKGFYSRQLRGKSYLDVFRLQNVEN